jgi:hypothetical protein
MLTIFVVVIVVDWKGEQVVIVVPRFERSPTSHVQGYSYGSASTIVIFIKTNCLIFSHVHDSKA